MLICGSGWLDFGLNSNRAVRRRFCHVLQARTHNLEIHDHYITRFKIGIRPGEQNLSCVIYISMLLDDCMSVSKKMEARKPVSVLGKYSLTAHSKTLKCPDRRAICKACALGRSSVGLTAAFHFKTCMHPCAAALSTPTCSKLQLKGWNVDRQS